MCIVAHVLTCTCHSHPVFKKYQLWKFWFSCNNTCFFFGKKARWVVSFSPDFCVTYLYCCCNKHPTEQGRECLFCLEFEGTLSHGGQFLLKTSSKTMTIAAVPHRSHSPCRFSALVPYLVAVTKYLTKQCKKGRAVLADSLRVPSSAGGHGGRNTQLGASRVCI